MIEVSGYTAGGIAYTLQHDPASDSGRGPLTGSSDAVALLELHTGEEFSASPTGRARVLDLADSASVLCALYALTQVTAVSGNVPDLFGPAVDGAIY